METNHRTALHKRQGQYTKREYAKKLFDILYKKPLSRRMAATQLGFPDQTYMVTQFVYDWIKQGKAQVIGAIKCSRSGRFVGAISTNPELFKVKNNSQLTLF
ncbi:hypothetical protein AAGF08_08780 [Algoriphagus sp. SE2]|uniref:hypothetical protein n=1 Tax=Algoriphagus sp. SE2 TaxID=3141536 RepID=UPI0031CD1480